MNVTVTLPNLGYRPAIESAEAQIDHLRTRIIPGNGTPELPVEGLLAVEKVRCPGLVLEEKIVRQMPLDVSGTNFLTAVVDCYRIVRGVDGAQYLERHPWSNDGVWQPGVPFYVTGEWDESLSPPMTSPMPRPEAIRRPVLTEQVIGQAEEQARIGRRGKAEIAADSRTPGRGK